MGLEARGVGGARGPGGPVFRIILGACGSSWGPGDQWSQMDFHQVWGLSVLGDLGSVCGECQWCVGVGGGWGGEG